MVEVLRLFFLFGGYYSIVFLIITIISYLVAKGRSLSGRKVLALGIPAVFVLFSLSVAGSIQNGAAKGEFYLTMYLLMHIYLSYISIIIVEKGGLVERVDILERYYIVVAITASIFLLAGLVFHLQHYYIIRLLVLFSIAVFNCWVIFVKLVACNGYSFLYILSFAMLSVICALFLCCKPSALSNLLNLAVNSLVYGVFILFFYNEDKILSLLHRDCNCSCISASRNEEPTTLLKDDKVDYGGNQIKKRLYELFENEKPYLDPDITIAKVAQMLCTNKSYLSKVLNINMEQNFKEFVNGYRVQEAKRLFKEDPSMTLKELSFKCGFRNGASFTNAFRLHGGKTPGEWCRSVKKKDKNEVDKRN